MGMTQLQKKTIIKDRIKYLKNSITTRISDIYDLDISLVEDVDLLVKTLEKNNYMTFPETSYRFNRVYCLFSNKTRDNDHYMSLLSKDNNNIEIPITELYHSDQFQLAVDDSAGEHFFNYRVLKYKPNNYSIVYFESKNVDLIKEITLIHPYSIANSFHELLKIMFEWQWALEVLNSTEPMAKICDEALTDMGISYQSDSLQVVKDINSIPDMYLAQYLKSQPLSINENDPIQSSSFKLWATESGFFNFYNLNYCLLYKTACSLQHNQKLLLEL